MARKYNNYGSDAVASNNFDKNVEKIASGTKILLGKLAETSPGNSVVDTVKTKAKALGSLALGVVPLFTAGLNFVSSPDRVKAKQESVKQAHDQKQDSWANGEQGFAAVGERTRVKKVEASFHEADECEDAFCEKTVSLSITKDDKGIYRDKAGNIRKCKVVPGTSRMKCLPLAKSSWN